MKIKKGDLVYRSEDMAKTPVKIMRFFGNYAKLATGETWPVNLLVRIETTETIVK